MEDENLNISTRDRVIDFNEVWRIVCKAADINRELEAFKSAKDDHLEFL